MKRKYYIIALAGVSMVVLMLALSARATVAQTPTSTPVPPSPTPPFAERYEGEAVKEILSVIGEVVTYLIATGLGALGFYLIKPRLDHWLERRKLRLEEEERKRQIEEEAIQRRQVEDERLQAYLDRVAEAYNHTRLVGHTRKIPLSDIFTEVYILDRPQAERRYDIQQLMEDSEQQGDPRELFTQLDKRSERHAGLKFLTDPDAHRLFILGLPGAGKTTFLRYLTCQAATGAIDKVPIFVALGDWADSPHHEDIIAYIATQFEVYNFPKARPYIEHLLEERDDALILFDGLDEIPQESDRRATAISALRDFAKRYERAQALITCRVAASDYQFEDFTYVEMAEFTEEQIHTYARKWFIHSDKKRDLFLQELEKPEHKNLYELARTPLFLGLLCLTFEETMSFPTRRVSLYTEALDALFKKWDSQRAVQRDYQMLDIDRKHQLFASLAHPAFNQGTYLFPQEQIVQVITTYMQRLPKADKVSTTVTPNAETILYAIEAQHGILVERAHRIHAFAHLTFQEYYVARYIVDNVSASKLSQLLSHADDDRWREVILLTSAMLGNADRFFEHFLKTLDNIVCGDEKIVAFLTWATRKAITIQSRYSPPFLRSFYCAEGFSYNTALAYHHALNRVRKLARDLAHNLGPTFDLTTTFVLDFTPDIERDLDLNIELAQNLEHALDSARQHKLDTTYEIVIDISLDLAYYLARARTRASTRASTRALARALARVRELASALDLEALYSILVDSPSKNASSADWQAYAERLREAMIEHRDIGHDWNFSEEQVQRLDRYFYAAELFVQCLDQAVVTNRAAIENRLLLPPSWDEDTAAQKQEQTE